MKVYSSPSQSTLSLVIFNLPIIIWILITFYRNLIMIKLSLSSTCRSLFNESNFFCLQKKQLVFSSTSTTSFHEKRDYKYDVPRYTKVNAWDKDCKQLKTLGKILSSKRDRSESDSVVSANYARFLDCSAFCVSPCFFCDVVYAVTGPCTGYITKRME